MGKEKCFNKEDIFQSQQTRKSRVPSHKVPQTKINLCNTGLGKKGERINSVKNSAEELLLKVWTSTLDYMNSILTSKTYDHF
jgi:hypothetical protein